MHARAFLCRRIDQWGAELSAIFVAADAWYQTGTDFGNGDFEVESSGISIPFSKSSDGYIHFQLSLTLSQRTDWAISMGSHSGDDKRAAALS